jgi:hypothetical protein
MTTHRATRMRVRAARTGCTASALIAATLLVASAPCTAAVLEVDQRGQTPGAYTTLAQAAAALQPGDTLRIVPGSGPYREVLDVRTTGTREAPITIEGSGELVTGFDPFTFTWNPGTDRFEYALTAPIGTAGPNGATPFRHLVTYRGERLLVDALTGRFTSEYATLSEDGRTLVLGNAEPDQGWEIGARSAVVRIAETPLLDRPFAWHHVYRNLRASGSTNDGFNLHGAGTDLRFQNIEAFHNFDEGFSAHDSIHASIDGAAFWGNDNGLYNQSSTGVALQANNLRAYANLGVGIAMRQGANVLQNAQAWDNGIQNIILGGTISSFSNTTYESRWTRPPYVVYQEAQGTAIDPDYAYEGYWKGRPPDAAHQAYRLSGEEPVVRPAARLPPFALPYADWRTVYFTSDQVADPATSGPQADPDGDGRSNLAEYQMGTHPRVADERKTRVSARVPDAVATSADGEQGRFEIFRDGDLQSTLQVYLASEGDAVADIDYARLDDSLAIPAGTASVTMPLTPLFPGSQTAPRAVVLRILSDPAYEIAAETGTVVIDPSLLPVVSLFVIDASASERVGEEGRLEVRRSGDPSAALQVMLEVSGSAAAGADFPAFATAIEFAPGESFRELVVAPVEDEVEEQIETVNVTVLPSAEYRQGGAMGTVFIEGTPLPTVTLETLDGAATETPGNGGTLLVRRSSGADPMSVNFSVSGTATQGVDYESIGSFVEIPAGELTAAVTIQPILDDVAESSESVTVALTSGDRYVLGNGRTGTVQIANYTPPVVTVLATDSGASEAAGNSGAFTVSRTGVKTSALVVAYGVGGTAENGTDYERLAGTATIPAGAGSVVVTVLPSPDFLTEGAETVTLSLAADPGYELGSTTTATVNIADVPPPTLSVAVTDAAATEAGNNTGALTISRSGARTAALSVSYTLSGTATPQQDYTALPASPVTIPAGSGSVAVTISPLSDLVNEPTERATLDLQAAEHYVLGSARSGSINIGNVAPVTVSIQAVDAQAHEGPADTALLVVSRSGDASAAMTVQLGISGSAQPDRDYARIPSEVTIPAGAASLQVSVTAYLDEIVEDTETIVVDVLATSSYLTGTPASATIIVTDTPRAAVSVGVADASASELGPDAGTFTVSRSGEPINAMTVSLAIAGSATAGSDYQALPTHVSLPAGASSVSLDVVPVSDAVSEPSETVVLSIAPGADYDIGTPSSGTVTIANATLPTVSLIVSDGSASEAPGNGGVFTVTRTGAKTAPLTVHFAMSGSATAAIDYRDPGSSVVVPAGSSNTTIALAPLHDGAVEGTEVATLSIQSHSGYLLGQTTSGSVNIADVPLPVVTLTAPDARAVEGQTDAGQFTLTRSGSRTAAMVVDLSAGGSAIAGEDYPALASSLTIPAGAGSVSVTLPATSDDQVEGEETVVLSILPQAHYSVGAPASATITISDPP